MYKRLDPAPFLLPVLRILGADNDFDKRNVRTQRMRKRNE